MVHRELFQPIQLKEATIDGDVADKMKSLTGGVSRTWDMFLSSVLSPSCPWNSMAVVSHCEFWTITDSQSLIFWTHSSYMAAQISQGAP